MKTQSSFFDVPGSTASQPAAPSTALVISGHSLAPEQKLFNQLLAKIEKHKLALQDLARMMGEHRSHYDKRISPLEMQQRVLNKQMVLFLDQRMQNGKGLSKKVRAGVAEIICGLAGALVHGPDGADMQILYERYLPAEMSGANTDAVAAMQSMMSDVFGLDIDEGEALDSPEQVMAAAMRKMQEKRDEVATRLAARKAARKKSPKQKQAEQESLDADKALRDIYRKLASALHPDRELDAQERLRKTALMVEVNVANEKKDLLALLQLQLKVEQISPESVTVMAQDKLRHFNRVLKEQVQSLANELAQAEFMFRTEFDLSYGVITPQTLQAALSKTVQRLSVQIDWMQKDLATIQDDNGLKVWVKEQQELMGDDFDELDMLELAAFGPGFSRAR